MKYTPLPIQKRYYTNKGCVKNYLESIEVPNFTPMLIHSLSLKYRYSEYITHVKSLYKFCDTVMSILKTNHVQKGPISNDTFFEKNIQQLSTLKALLLKATYEQNLSSTEVENLFNEMETECEVFLATFNTHFRSDGLFRDSFDFSESAYLAILEVLPKYSFTKSSALTQFLQNIFRFAFPRGSSEEEGTQFLLLAHDEPKLTSISKISGSLVELARLFTIQTIATCRFHCIESYLKCLVLSGIYFFVMIDVNRIAILRPTSPFLLAIRILEKSSIDFTEILNLLFLRIASTSSSSNFFARKKIFLYELLSQALHANASPGSGTRFVTNSQKLIPCYTYSLFQLIFYYIFESLPLRERDAISIDISQFFKEIKKAGKASLLSYAIYAKFLKFKGSIEDVRLLESEMNSIHWLDDINKLRELSDIIPRDNGVLFPNIHYFMQYLLDEQVPNPLRLFSNSTCLNSVFIPLSAEDAKDIILISAYSKFNLWADVYRIYSNIKSDGRLDIPASGLVRSPMFHLSLSTIIFKNVLSNISWGEVMPYIEAPSPLLSREGFRLIYTHLYSNLFNLLVAHDKFLLIQSIVAIPRSLFIQDDYILTCALSTFACSSGRGPLSPPNRILFYKLLSNRLDIDITCESSPTPPSNMAGVMVAVDPQLSNLLHFIELHKIPLSPSNFLSLLLSLFRRRRYDLICQTFNFKCSYYRKESYLHYVYLSSALKNREYGIVKTIIDEKNKNFTIPEQNLLYESISTTEVGRIFPSSMSSVTALDKWRECGLVSDSDYSHSLAICLNYNLETLFYLRRFISLQQQEQEPGQKVIKHGLKEKFPESIIKLTAIPNYLLDYENKYFSNKKRANVVETEGGHMEEDNFSHIYLLESENPPLRGDHHFSTSSFI